MKILHICPDFPLDSRGGETFDLLSRSWSKMGHDVTVITSRPYDSDKGSAIKSDYILHEIRMTKYVWLFPEAKLFFPIMGSERDKLKSFITNYSGDYDIILIHGLLESVSRLSLRTVKRNRNVILTNHGLSMGSYSPVIKPISALIYLIFGNIFIRKLKFITVYSNFALRQQSVFFGKLPKIIKFQFPLGIDTSALQYFVMNPDHGSVLSMPNYIFAVGRHVRVKGFETLLRSFKDVRAKFPNEILIIAGKKNNYTMKLMDLASRLGLSDSISFIGYIDEKKKIGLIARADAFVIPSLSEGYGLNAIYAKVLDVPTVATNTGNHKEILSGSEKALIIKPGDSGQLTEAIISLLGKKNSMNRSPDLMALDNYDIENTAREYIKIFEQVLAYS